MVLVHRRRPGRCARRRSQRHAQQRCSPSGSWGRRSNVHPPAWPSVIRLANGTRATCSLPRPFPPNSTTFMFITFSFFHALAQPARTTSTSQERARVSLGKDRSLERVDRHEIRVLSNLFRNARIPVLDLDENPFAVIVPRVTHVEREPWIPNWWTWSAADVTCGELTGDLFDDVIQRVIGEVTYTEASVGDSQRDGECVVLVLKTSPSQNWR